MIQWSPSVESHVPVLAEYVPRTEGPILELGVGASSTPLLHAIAAPDRTIVSVDNDRAWLDAATQNVVSSRHRWVWVRDWSSFAYDSQYWGLALVDNAPGAARAIAVAALRNHADVIVVHDTDLDAAENYPGLHAVLDSFPYRRDFDGGIRTTIVSAKGEPR